MEAARDIISNSNAFTLVDLYATAEKHAESISLAVRKCEDIRPLVIIDTDVYITQSYASLFFNTELQLKNEIYLINAADIVLYLDCDVPFVQDGTRVCGLEVRDELDRCHRKTLEKYRIPFQVLSGPWEDKFKHAALLISALFEI